LTVKLEALKVQQRSDVKTHFEEIATVDQATCWTISTNEWVL